MNTCTAYSAVDTTTDHSHACRVYTRVPSPQSNTVRTQWGQEVDVAQHMAHNEYPNACNSTLPTLGD